MTDPGFSPGTSVPKQRLLSLDALRGLDMLCIIGGGEIVREVARLWPGPVLDSIAAQFEHVKWEGLHFYDLIFPLFIFLSGTAIPFSLDARMAGGEPPRKLWAKIASRACLLVVLGIIYNGALSANPADPRLPSVLGQIGVAWGIAASVHLLVRDTRAKTGILLGWLIAIAAVQLLVPIPGHGAGNLTEAGSVNAWLDRMIVPGRLHRGTFDPEGLLCCVSAASVAMAGALAGVFLKRPSVLTWKTPAWLAAAGGVSVLLAALCWSLGYPPVKMLWTSSFNLFAIGISTLMLALFFGIIDVARVETWSFPLRVIGLNCLTIYLAARLVSFPGMSAFLFGRLAGFSGVAAPLAIIAGVVVLEWTMLYFMYRKRWFLKV
jgi:predicted acyltransferase